ncbi:MULTISPECIES: hypothetical protein [unclassified Rhizobium]|uniref:hypothetical protein n=1 Tax=unclassified Rhizobium TaxID=2613769 RepID=UPI0010D82688|nr:MULTISPECIES: hypothetical protein [unclassified Rhizobium]MBB4171981.1 hypothetical protein [Rhizobium sp. BK538]TCM60057.1 hypothetical protein EV291_1713 [Rhizobium sp. BK068]
MRISTITNWVYAVTVVLTVLSGGAFILSAHSAVRERAAVETRQRLDELVDQLALAAEQTTEDARLFAMRREERHLQAFRGAQGEERAREEAIKGLKSTDLSPPELFALRRLETDAEALDQIEEKRLLTTGTAIAIASGKPFSDRSTNACRPTCSQAFSISSILSQPAPPTSSLA